jgi:hypothetical protein
MKEAIARTVLYVVTERYKVGGGKLSSTAALAQGNQDCTRVNVSRSSTPSRNISNVKVPILFVFIWLLADSPALPSCIVDSRRELS